MSGASGDARRALEHGDVRAKRLTGCADLTSAGMGHIRMDEPGVITYHQDYRDAATHVFTHLPLVAAPTGPLSAGPAHGNCPMSSLAPLIRYLELTLAACRRRPERHRHQLEAYQRQLELARAATDSADYCRRLDPLALARAEWLDRYQGVAALYEAVGDREQEAAARARVRAGHEPDFLAAIVTAEHTWSPRLAAAQASREALAPMVMALVDWRTAASEPTREGARTDVCGLWHAMGANDPGLTWARVAEYAPYRYRLPFAGEGLAALGTWLEQALTEADYQSPAATSQDVGESVEAPPAPNEPAAASAGASTDPTSEIPAPPSVADLARPYHLTYQAEDWDGRDDTRALYQRIFALEAELASGDASVFLARLAEEDLITGVARAPHLDWADGLATHAAGRAQPAMAQHAARLRVHIGAAPTPTVVEYERRRLDLRYQIESAWDQVFVHAALRPLTIVLADDDPDGAERDRSLGTAAAACRTLFGLGWHELMAASRLSDFFRAELVPALTGAGLPVGARRGQAGVAVVQAAAGSLLAPSSSDPAVLQSQLDALISAAAAPPEPPGQARLYRWGSPLALDEVGCAAAPSPDAAPGTRALAELLRG